MGYGRYNPSDYEQYSRASTTLNSSDPKTTYSATNLDPALDPSKFKFRESCDSEQSPNSTPVIIGMDVTGSMGHIPHYMIQKGFPKLMPLIYDRKPISDPHVLFAAIGDVKFDKASLQVTQFEVNAKNALEQMEKLWLEEGGGGNMQESYNLTHFWAAMCTKTDCWDKHGRKGVLITVGDEEPMRGVTRQELERVLGTDHGLELAPEYSAQQLVDLASKKWDVYHLIIEEGSNFRAGLTDKLWRELLGERAIMVRDHTKLAEIIVSVLEVEGGKDKDAVASSWDGSTAVVIKEAVKNLTVGGAKVTGGVATL